MSYEDYSPERYLFNAAMFLDGIGEKEAAKLLATCDLTLFSDYLDRPCIKLLATPDFYNLYLQDENIKYDEFGKEVERFPGPLVLIIKKSFGAIFPGEDVQILMGLKVMEFEENWRDRLLLEVDTSQIDTNSDNPLSDITMLATEVVSEPTEPTWNYHKSANIFWLAIDIFTTISIMESGEQFDVCRGIYQIHWHVKQLNLDHYLQSRIVSLTQTLDFLSTEDWLIGSESRKYMSNELQLMYRGIVSIFENADPDFQLHTLPV